MVRTTLHLRYSPLSGTLQTLGVPVLGDRMTTPVLCGIPVRDSHILIVCFTREPPRAEPNNGVLMDVFGLGRESIG